VLRKLLIAAALAGAAVLPAGGASAASPSPVGSIVSQSLLMPNVGYQRLVQFTPRGPVVLDVVTAPRPDGSLYTLAPALSNGAIVGTEKLTDMQKDVSGTSTTVGVNGDFFAANPGTPTGILIRGGSLDSAPATGRSSLGIGADGSLTVAKVAFDGTWRGTSQRRQLDLNAKPVNGHTTLYTSAWGPVTPAESTAVVEDVIQSLPQTRANTVVRGLVTQAAAAGGTPIPPGGAVLVSRGTQIPHLTAEAPAGTTVELRLTLTPNWGAMAYAIGGGPALVTGGKAVFRTNEAFGDPILNTRGARSAVGQLSDGRILLVTVEGASAAYSVGMTNYELAVAMQRLGAVNAMALGNGSAASMAFDGTLLSRPSTGGTEQPLSDALLLSYAGAYAAPPAADVLSPNGDGVADTQTFSYKLVRQSQVTATVTGPDGSTQTLAADSETPGVHTLQWAGTTAAGTPAPEGNWTFQVTGADDQGRTTTATRAFSLNETLGALQVTPAAAHLAAGATAATVTFQLVHPATVTATIETRTGIVIATLTSSKLQPGAQQLPWDGRSGDGKLAFTGAYQVHVVATNSIGTVSLTAPFTARRS
jgi:flagellar hook assembly protein FlgD